MSEPAATKEHTEILGRYALFGEIASGGMATVHFGKLLGAAGFSRPVAIKRLHPQLAKEENVRAMFTDEARLAARIHHPNVVQTLDVIEDKGQLLLVMEYVHGESVGKLMKTARKRGERIPIPIILAIMTNVMHGLHAAHEATTENGEPLHIVHRDVSPQNVIVGTDGVSRVLDFGIARAAVRIESTREGLIKGKLAYMAPEQLMGATITRQADLFSAGVVLWEMLTGKRLFIRGDEGDSVLIEKLLRGILEPPSTHREGLLPALDAICGKALERETENRYATAREMALALEKVGPLATPTDVSEWVDGLAHDSLAARAGQLRELERSSTRIRAAAPSVSTDAVDELLTPPSNLSVSTPSLNAAIQPTNPVPARGAHTWAPPQKRSLAFAVGAVIVAAVLIGGVRTTSSTSGGLSSHAASMGPGASRAALAPPPKPTCPQGMQTIPGGKFFMGSDDDLPMEAPAHNVQLAPYCIDTFEVTTESFRECSDHGECKRAGIVNEWNGITETEHHQYDTLCNIRDPNTKKDHPINCVDWEMATIYCKAKGKRLPTEAEWEFAARGPDGRKYPWGDEAPSAQLLNACGKECLGWGKKNHVNDLQSMFDADDGWATTAPVGSFPKGASRYGVQDVVGNVWEWVSDFYAEYSKEDQVDPKGPGGGEDHVIRGGAWNGSYAAWVRPTFRYKAPIENRSYGIGFRCAQPL